MSLILSPAPHVRTKNTTQRLMLNVVISLLPCAAAGIYYFGLRAAIVLAVSVVSAVLAELVWQKLAHQTVRINDFSAGPAAGPVHHPLRPLVDGDDRRVLCHHRGQAALRRHWR